MKDLKGHSLEFCFSSEITEGEGVNDSREPRHQYSLGDVQLNPDYTGHWDESSDVCRTDRPSQNAKFVHI